VVEEVNGFRRGILERARDGTRYETRRNAVEVLRKISKSVLLCVDGAYNGMLETFLESITGLVERMDGKERERFKDEGFYDKLVEMRKVVGMTKGGMMKLAMIYEFFGGERKEGSTGESLVDGDRLERERAALAREARQK